MKLTYDPRYNVAYLSFQEKAAQVETIRIRFLSCEPLIGSLAGIDLRAIHWVIVGGESGPHSRSMKIEWVREIFRACRKQKVPFFFKQWGGVRKDLTGRELGRRTYDEMPMQFAA